MPVPTCSYPDSDASAMACRPAGGKDTTSTSRWVDASGIVWNNGCNSGRSDPRDHHRMALTTTGSNIRGSDRRELCAEQGKHPRRTFKGSWGLIGPNDVLVVYFSGHGTQDTSVTPPHEYFDPYGAVMQDWYRHRDFSSISTTPPSPSVTTNWPAAFAPSGRRARC